MVSLWNAMLLRTSCLQAKVTKASLWDPPLLFPQTVLVLLQECNWLYICIVLVNIMHAQAQKSKLWKANCSSSSKALASVSTTAFNSPWGSSLAFESSSQWLVLHKFSWRIIEKSLSEQRGDGSMVTEEWMPGKERGKQAQADLSGRTKKEGSRENSHGLVSKHFRWFLFLFYQDKKGSYLLLCALEVI